MTDTKPKLHPRFTDPTHPDWDPRELPPERAEEVRKLMDFIEPTNDALFKLLVQAASQLYALETQIEVKRKLAELTGGPPPEPTADEAATVVSVAQGVHFAINIWFDKMVHTLQAEVKRAGVAEAKNKAATKPDPAPRTTARGATLH